MGNSIQVSMHQLLKFQSNNPEKIQTNQTKEILWTNTEKVQRKFSLNQRKFSLNQRISLNQPRENSVKKSENFSCFNLEKIQLKNQRISLVSIQRKFSSGEWPWLWEFPCLEAVAVLMGCENPVNSPLYMNTNSSTYTSCINKTVQSSSQTHN